MTSGGRRWFDDLPAVTAEVGCGGHRHRVTWRRGKLVVEDHDLLAERSLGALGAEPPWCVQILDAWRQPRLGLDMLERLLLDDSELDPDDLLSRRLRYETAIKASQQPWPGPPMSGAAAAAMAARFSAFRESELARERRMWTLTLIEALPPEFRRRFALAAIVNCIRHSDDEDLRDAHRPVLESVLRAVAGSAFERSVRRWRRNLKPYASVLVDARLVAPGQRPGCRARIDHSGASVLLLLPLTWLIDVWDRGIALVDDCFVLQVMHDDGDPSSLHVVAVRFERKGRDLSWSVEAPAIVTRGAGGASSLGWL